MAKESIIDRGTWNTKLGFILAAAGSAVGLGNIWRFPTVMADNGGAAFLLIYALLVFLIGYPVMVAEMTLGRKSQKNPFGTFKSLSSNRFFPFVGIWCVLCGVAVLSFYVIIAGWTISYFFEQILFSFGFKEWAAWIADLDNGWVNAGVAIVFMALTIFINIGGISGGIERAVRLMMPLLVIIIVILIVYVLFQPGSGVGIREYLIPDFSKINMNLIFSAMGQAFFSLSLGMGALITYGSYLSKRENIPEAAAYVTVFDIGIAFLAGLLIMPTIFMAQEQGLTVFDSEGNLVAGIGLIFQVLPNLFHEIGGITGLVFGASFFFLLSLAALTSSISLLEVPVSFAIDEFNIRRRNASVGVGLAILCISIFLAFNTGLIDYIDFIFSEIGLPLGGFFTIIFLGYIWKMHNAKEELGNGFKSIDEHWFMKIWTIFVKYIIPVIILLILFSTVYSHFNS
ncbi:MAG: sodium-dependent transporter [Balneolaceae bacterium]